MIVSERSGGITAPSAATNGNTNAQVTAVSGSITFKSNPLQRLIPPGMGTVTTAAAMPDTLSAPNPARTDHAYNKPTPRPILINPPIVRPIFHNSLPFVTSIPFGGVRPPIQTQSATILRLPASSNSSGNLAPGLTPPNLVPSARLPTQDGTANSLISRVVMPPIVLPGRATSTAFCFCLLFVKKNLICPHLGCCPLSLLSATPLTLCRALS